MRDITLELVTNYMEESQNRERSCREVARDLGISRQESARCLRGLAASRIIRRLPTGVYALETQQTLM